MREALPFDIESLVKEDNFESDRLEYKSIFDENTKPKILHTICAFANDFLHLNGGYVVIGIEDLKGRPLLPPIGIHEGKIDNILRDLAISCANQITPRYVPLIYVAKYQSKNLIVIWAPAGDNPPYETQTDKGGKVYYLRISSTTQIAKDDLKRQFLEQAAKIPFDDRRNLIASITDISPVLVQNYLRDIRSSLGFSEDFKPLEVFQKLKLVVPTNNHFIPRNVALLFFNEDPEKFFRGAHIDVVQFGERGDLMEEREFRGPVQNQISSSLEYLNSLGGRLIEKIPGRAEVDRTVPYPYEALEESIVNAVYHRSYEHPPEPIKIYLYIDRMEIISYPGPVPGIKKEHINEGHIPPVPARNRRIGELLKDLRLAEARGTGIPKILRKMKENGSPDARFDFDADKTYFRVTLPVHPRYLILNTLRDAILNWTQGDKKNALEIISKAYEKSPSSGALAAHLIEYLFHFQQSGAALDVFKKFESQTNKTEISMPYLTLANVFLNRQQNKDAIEILRKMPSASTYKEMFEAAILKKRAGDYEGAHALLEQAYSINPDDAQVLLDFGQVKVKLADRLWGSKYWPTRKLLYSGALEILRKGILLSDNVLQKAWAWFYVANILNKLRKAANDIEGAYLQAMGLLPEERRFIESYEHWKLKRSQGNDVKSSYLRDQRRQKPPTG